MSIDKYNLRRVILEEYKQFEEGFRAAGDAKAEGEFDRIMISGMGGSALPGNIFRILLNGAWNVSGGRELQVYQNRFYSLPKEANDRCLNFICSHSGNTEETVASLEEAIEKKLPVVGMASGGKVEELCRAHDLPFVKLPTPFENFQPRMATGHFVSALYKVLVNSGVLEDQTEELLAAGAAMREKIVSLEAQGKEIAGMLKGKTPVIFAGVRYKALAMVLKIQINENAKTPAFWNFFPELNHNEMVGYTQPQAKFFALMLRDSEDDPRNLKRYEIAARLLEEKGLETRILDMPGKTVYDKVFLTLALGGWISYYLALEYGIDPTPVDMVEDFKRLLQE